VNVSGVFIGRKMDGEDLEKDDKFGVKDDQTKLKNGENVEEKLTKMRAVTARW